MHRKSRLYPFAGAALSLGLLALLPGCGGGGGGSSSGGSSNSNYLSTSDPLYASTAGTYTGTYSRSDNNESGTVTVTLASNGAVTGQLLSGSIGGQTQSGFPVTLTGNFQLFGGNSAGSTGTLNITGTSSPNFSTSTGNFTITSGTLIGQNGVTGYEVTKQSSGGNTGATVASLAGSYKITSIADPGAPSFTCPGSTVNQNGVGDSCTADDIDTLNANGTFTSTSVGTTEATGTVSVSGTTITLNYTVAGSSTAYTDTFSFTTNGGTLATTTRLTSNQPGNIIGTVTTYTKQ